MTDRPARRMSTITVLVLTASLTMVVFSAAPASAATLVLKPVSASVGANVKVTGTGYPASTTVYLVWDPTCPGPDKTGGFPLGSVVSDPAGAISTTFTVPQSWGIPTSGHTVRATDDAVYTPGCGNGGTVSQDAAFDVSAKLTTNTGNRVNSGSDFCLRASGFGATELVTFTWDFGGPNEQVLGSTTMDGTGARSFCTFVPNDTGTVHVTRATGAGGTADTPTRNLTNKQFLQISSHEVSSGMTVTWTATGFSAPSCTVTLVDSNTATTLDTAAVDGTGTASGSFTVPALANGIHTWTATDCNTLTDSASERIS